jgi:cysteinyl-tRNA synthetase
MANVWLHNGFLQVEGEKMSKSLGNFVTIHELLDTDKFGGRKWPGEVLRLAMLMTHYREPIDFSVRRLVEAETILTQLYRKFDAVWPVEPTTPDNRILEPLLDDLNTVAAINILRGTTHDAAAGEMIADFTPVGYEFAKNAGAVLSAARTLGLLLTEPASWLRPRARSDDGTIDNLIAARLEARKRKDFKESDRIRDELAKMGIALKDTKNKETGEIETTWEVAR